MILLAHRLGTFQGDSFIHTHPQGEFSVVELDVTKDAPAYLYLKMDESLGVGLDKKQSESPVFTAHGR